MTAIAESILFQINSSNYSGDIFTIYKPQTGCSGFITTLRLTVDIKSIDAANFPYIPDDTPANVLQEILNEVALNTPFKEVVLFYKKGSGAWLKRAPIQIFNKEPYYDINLIRYFSDANTIDVSEDLSLGIQLKIGNVLAPADTILVWGTAVEEKKSDPTLEAFSDRISALETLLSVFGSPSADLPGSSGLTPPPPAGGGEFLLRGDRTWENPSKFATPAQITAAINNLRGTTSAGLDTFQELAAAVGNDANFAATVMNLLTEKVSLTGDQVIEGVKTFNNNLRLNGTFASTDHFGTANTGTAGFQAGLDVAGNVSLSLFGGQASKLCYFDFAVNPGIDNDARFIASTTELTMSTAANYYFNLGTRLKASLPTSSAGLPSGAIWRNGSVLNIV